MWLIKKIPVPICGLALALASLGNFLESYGQGLRYAFGAVALLIALLFTLRLILDFPAVKKELGSPAVFGVLPTFDMTWMVLATYINPWHAGLAKFIWYGAVFLHAVLLVIFTKKFVLHFDVKNVFPTWFVMFIGFVVGSVTSGAMGTQGLGSVLFYLGFIAYLVLLVLVSYRVFVVKEMPEATLPSLAIYTAPPHLCLAGYFGAVNNPHPAIVLLLFGLGIISYLGVLLALPKLLKLPFYPSFSAFTFPLVISTVAQKTVYTWLGEGYGIYLPPLVNTLTTILALAVVLYVLLRYLGFLLPTEKLEHI